MQPIPPEIEFLHSTGGDLIVIVLSLAACAVMVLWARRPGHPDRWIAVLAAGGATMIQAAISLVAVAAGWWVGVAYDIPLAVQLAILLPFGIAGFTLWLGGYRWLAARIRHALLVYAVVVLAFVPIVIVADRINMAHGLFSLSNGYTLWTDVIVGQVVMWSPMLLFEGIRRTRHRSASPQRS